MSTSKDEVKSCSQPSGCGYTPVVLCIIALIVVFVIFGK